MCRAAGVRGEKVQLRWNAGAAMPQEESSSVGGWRVTRRSRAMLVWRLRSQKARLEFGLVEHLGLMCQLPLPSGARMPETAIFKL
jgi:hypothetical protein